MLLARDAWGAHLGHPTCSSLHRHFPDQDPVMWLDWALWVLWLQDAPQRQPSGNFGKKDSWLTGPGGHIAHPGPHIVVGVEGGREGVRTWGSAFIRVPGGVREVLWVHSLLANLKHKSGNWGTGREKRDYLSGHLPRSPRAFWKGTFLGWRPAPHLVV